MSIVCTLEPKVNLFKGSTPTKNVLLLKNNSNAPRSMYSDTTNTTDYNSSYNNNYSNSNNNNNNGTRNNKKNQNILPKEKISPITVNTSHPSQACSLDYKPRISVAEFVARQQQAGVGAINESTPDNILSRSRIVVPVAMPEILNAVTLANNNNINNNINNNNINNNNSNNANKSTNSIIGGRNSFKLSPTVDPQSTSATMNNARMASISPTLSMNGNSNEASNVHGLSMYGPMSPQSSDSGNSMSDMTHMGSNAKYGSNFNGSSASYDSQNGGSQHSDSQSHNGSSSMVHHKDLFTQRKQREFTPDNKKDDSYWDRRRRNNEAAKRSREKRRYNDMVLEQRVVELTKENHVLKAQLDAIRDKFNISGENLVSVEQIMASLPTSEQVLSITKRAKISANGTYHSNQQVIATPTIVYGGNTPNAQNMGVAPHSVAQKMNQVQSGDMTNNGGNQECVKSAGLQSPQLMKSVNHPSHLTNTHSVSSQPILQHSHPGNNAGNDIHMSTAQSSPHHAPVQHYLHQHHSPVSEHYPPAATPPINNSVNSNSAAISSIPANVNGQIMGPSPTHGSSLQNLHVLQALNRNVNPDDIDNLRKVVAVVGAMTTNVGGSSVERPLYSGTTAPMYAGAPPNNSIYTSAGSPHHMEIDAATTYHHHHQHQHQHQRNLQQSPVEAAISSSAADSVSSSSPMSASVLNLSRRACSPTYEHILSSTTPSSRLSSASSSSGAVSGDDEQEHDHAEENEHSRRAHHLHHRHHHHNVGMSTTSPNSSNDSNNSLPLKLRHKSHLGDKDAAATALLALQHIKQEPISSRASPPGWNDTGDNSSDERDSGISIGSAEWTAQLHQRKLLAAKSAAESTTSVNTATVVSPTEREHILKSQLARLESEVASIKNMMIFSAEQSTGASSLKG